VSQRPIARPAKVTGYPGAATPYGDLVRMTARLTWLAATLRTLRGPRYIALSALMLVVALGCIGAGTWQIVRFEQKVHANDEITANAHARPAAVGSVLALVGQPAPSEDSVRYRTITASGKYQPQGQSLIRLRSVGGRMGFYVLAPLRTTRATLLVVRGFVAQQADGSPPDVIAPAPTGTVHITARAEPGESETDLVSGIPAGQLRSVNPGAQAARSGAPTYDGYVQLLPEQPGTKGVTPLPPPDLSNPAGGAVEPQHFAYIIQWYIFAILALAAPFAMVRADRRERERTAAASHEAPHPSPESAAAEPAPIPASKATADERRAAKLADRYGRPVPKSSDRGVS
jgi:cytochrome oxidase assembly protein ShyY1